MEGLIFILTDNAGIKVPYFTYTAAGAQVTIPNF